MRLAVIYRRPLPWWKVLLGAWAIVAAGGAALLVIDGLGLDVEVTLLALMAVFGLREILKPPTSPSPSDPAER